MEKYLHIESSDGKVWLLPEDELKTALCLYQPSSAKGKLLKILLPIINRFGRVTVPLYNRVGLKHIVYSVEKEIECYLEGLFCGDDQIRYAMFLGTPSVHQKTTIQVFSKGNIYGYCKIANNPAIYSIFKHEEQVLRYLHEHGINNVPQCISCKELAQKQYSFVQTTTKTIKSTVHHELSVGGVPAKVIRYRFTKEQIESLLDIQWWNKDEKWLREHAGLFDDVDGFLSYCACIKD